MASTVWKGYISFGLVSVPVRLFVAARETHVSFNQIHKTCGTRVKQQLYCPTDERVVERKELAKGYQVDKDTYVIVTDEELKELEAESSETMEIVQFVKLADVDPIYYQTSYYTVAEEPGRRAYALMMQSMLRLGVAAVAKLTLHQREQMVLVRPYHDKGMVLHTLYYPAEVREIAEFGKDENLTLQKPEIDLAEQFMQHLVGEFKPQDMKDEYEERVIKLVESKQAGHPDEPEKPKRKLAPVIDLMEALKKSIEAQADKKQPQRAESASVAEANQAAEAPAQAKAPVRRRKTG